MSINLTPPSAHAGLGKARVVIGDHGIDADASGEALFGGGDGFHGLLKLCPRGQQRGAVPQCPAVILRVGDLHALGRELLDERDHLFEVVDVLPVDDKIHGERDFVAADDARQFDLVRVCFGAGNPVGCVLARILKADLDVIESGVDQCLQSCFSKADAGRDQIGVEACGARSRDEFGQIRTRQRFAAGEVRVQHSQLARLLENIDPFRGGKLRTHCSQLQRIGAIDAVQRAAVRDLGDEGERVGNHRGCAYVIEP